MLIEGVAAVDAVLQSGAHAVVLSGLSLIKGMASAPFPAHVAHLSGGARALGQGSVVCAFGDLLRRYRKGLNLTQGELGERAGLSYRTISDLERGVRRAPYPDNETALVKALDLEEDEERAFRAVARAQRHAPACESAPAEMADKADKADKEDTTKTARAGEAAHGAGASLAILPSGPDVDEWSFPSLGAVPVALSSLVGRERDEAALIHALSQHRLVTMTGPGGVGKTRLSLQMGALLRDAGMRTLFVDCSEATSPSSLLNLLAHALDVGMQSDMPVLRGLAVLFSSVPTLLILDNFEQVIGAESVLTVLLGHAPGLRLLVTSRIALHVKGEQEYPLSPLSTPHPEDINLDVVLASPAVRLFIQRVQAYRVSFSVTPQNMGAVAALCAYLDGLPLSIELVSWYARVFEPGDDARRAQEGRSYPGESRPGRSDAPPRSGRDGGVGLSVARRGRAAFFPPSERL